MKKNILFLLIILIFSACSYKPKRLDSKSYLVTFKLNKLKFSDTGFLNIDKDYLNLQVFSAGMPILNLKIYNQVCVDFVCKSRREFTDEYLNKNYPEELFENILNKRAIFNAQNLEKTKNGISQKITSPKYDIIYKIENNDIYFKDKINKVFINLKEFKN